MPNGTEEYLDKARSWYPLFGPIFEHGIDQIRRWVLTSDPRFRYVPLSWGVVHRHSGKCVFTFISKFVSSRVFCDLQFRRCWMEETNNLVPVLGIIFELHYVYGGDCRVGYCALYSDRNWQAFQMCFSIAIVLSMLLWNVGHFLRGYTSSCSSPWEPKISPPWWLTDWHIRESRSLMNWQIVHHDDLWVTRHPLAGLVLTNAVEWGVPRCTVGSGQEITCFCGTWRFVTILAGVC